jgi:hypothetical protein
VSEARAEVAPAEISALYRITLNGFEIGTLRYTSTVTRNDYTLASDVELSALLGAFHWKGVTRTAGTIAGNDPKPAGFSFEFESTTKSGSVKMGFNPGGVASVSIAPPGFEASDAIPVQAQHLRGVLDPLTAILALTQVESATPCGRKLSIFDGKQRFDLELNYRRQTPVAEGQPDMVIVCRVKYVPIAGYTPSEETKRLANNTGIEIAFRPVPSAHLMLPQQLTIPTLVGPAEITVLHVDITTPDRGQIALVN